MSTDGLADVDDLSATKQQLANEMATKRAAIDKLRSCDPTRADGAAADLDAWAATVTKAIADEDACRATPSCMAPRIAAQLCSVLADRRDAREQIAAERRNPGGVVDLRFLHDMGQRVQGDDETIAGLRTKYAALTRQPFSETACAKTPTTP